MPSVVNSNGCFELFSERAFIQQQLKPARDKLGKKPCPEVRDIEFISK